MPGVLFIKITVWWKSFELFYNLNKFLSFYMIIILSRKEYLFIYLKSDIWKLRKIISPFTNKSTNYLPELYYKDRGILKNKIVCL